MDYTFTHEEIIDMILSFYTFTQGYWKDEIDQYPAVKAIVNMEGLTKANDEHPDLIVLTKKGGDYFHEYIKEISEKFILFAKSKGLEGSHEDAKEWFVKEYNLNDEYTGEEIADYICGNLYHYGFKAGNAYSRRKGDFYHLEPVSES